MSEQSGDAPLSVAFHIDQLWFSAPGGIGTYVRQLGAELERSNQVVLTPFRSRWKHEGAGVPATTVPIVTTNDCPSRIGGIVAGFVACTTRHPSSACGSFGRRATDHPR